MSDLEKINSIFNAKIDSVKIKEDLYQVKSSTDHTKSYFVTLDSCECQGFKNFYKFHHGKGLKANCSHLEAIRIFQKENQ